MQKILLGPAGSPTGSTLSSVAEINKLELHAMEVAFTHGIRMKNALAEQIGTEQEKQKVRLSIHAPYYINLASHDPSKIGDSKKRILHSAELAHLMHASPVVFHPGFYGKHKKEDVYDMIKSAIDEIQELINQNKWNVEIAPETMGRVAQFGTFEEIVDIAKETKSSFCIDICHIYARNQGKIDYDYIFDELKHLREYVHFQFSGVEFGEKGEKRHLVIDQAGPDFKEFAAALLESKLSATIICESPVTWQDSLKMKKILENLGHKF